MGISSVGLVSHWLMTGKYRIQILLLITWGISSVGLERLLDRQEVTGSNPVCPT